MKPLHYVDSHPLPLDPAHRRARRLDSLAWLAVALMALAGLGYCVYFAVSFKVF